MYKRMYIGMYIQIMVFGSLAVAENPTYIRRTICSSREFRF